jgi:hypothetical protein
MRRLDLAATGLYAWSTAFVAGLTLADVLFASTRSVPPTAGSAVADLLLEVVAVLVMLGLLATASVWDRPRVRAPLLASLAIVVIGSFTPLLLGGVADAAERSLGVSIGPALRLGEVGLASVAAFVGFWRAMRARRPAPRARPS